jgi:hypothetical protein
LLIYISIHTQKIGSNQGISTASDGTTMLGQGLCNLEQGYTVRFEQFLKERVHIMQPYRQQLFRR